MQIQLQATVSGLTVGKTYNLYEYDLASPTGNDADTGENAALEVPTARFNENRAMASSTYTFVADGPTHTKSFTINSDQILVLRAVSDTAP